MNLFQYCLENYGYDEPILAEKLQSDSNLTIKDSTLRMNLKRLADEGRIKRYARGIYFIPQPNSLLKNQTLSINKVIRKKYLYDGSKPIGYQTDRKSTRLNSSHVAISYAVFCLKKKIKRE